MVIPHPLSHAYILTGGNAASRRAYAIRLAQAYVCEEARPPCLHCRHCEKAAGGIHPDVITVSPAEGKREILIDQARALRADAYIRPNEAARKVYLIDPADSMNAAVQNTLLKVLEEGPPYAAFLLLAEQTGGLLATIRSRCETLALPPEEEPADPALQSAAEELAQLLLGEDELALMTWLAEQESAKRKKSGGAGPVRPDGGSVAPRAGKAARPDSPAAGAAAEPAGDHALQCGGGPSAGLAGRGLGGDGAAGQVGRPFGPLNPTFGGQHS